MDLAEQSAAKVTPRRGVTIAVAATFTAEPLQDALAFWMSELDLDATIDFAPYNQVFQELLDPGSLLSRNHGGVNLLLLRVEDWLRFDGGAGAHEAPAQLDRNARDLVDALRAATARSAAPHLLVFC